MYGTYPPDWKIRLVLDDHSSHISKQIRAFLEARPNRFEFTFTPKHGSWLNLVESFFGKMARTLLRGVRVASKEELRERILRYLDEIKRGTRRLPLAIQSGRTFRGLTLITLTWNHNARPLGLRPGLHRLREAPHRSDSCTGGLVALRSGAFP